MCFSQEVSFAAAAVLGAISAISFQTVKGYAKYYPLALIPLFFALQQFGEGMQWHNFVQDPTHQTVWARTLFLTIAYIVWPFWISFALWSAEPDERKKKMISRVVMVGLLLSLFNLYRFFSGPAHSEVIQNSIYYTSNIPYHEIWLYSALVIGPWFLSTLPKAAFVGLAFLTSTAVANYAYYDTFTSVWCFFAALVSGLILAMLMEAKKDTVMQP